MGPRVLRIAVLLLALTLVGTAAPRVHADSRDETAAGTSPPLDDAAVDDRASLAPLEIPYSREQIIGGGVVGTLVGFGLGHAIQGRFHPVGTIFLAGEGGALTAGLAGMTGCVLGHDNDAFRGATCGLVVGGVATSIFLAFRIAEIVEIWAHPLVHNKRIEERARRRRVSWAPVITPVRDGGATFGLAFRF